MNPSVVVWWTIDSLRPDVTSVYEGAADTSALVELAESGQTYECQAEATWTLPSVTSILTGKAPDQHGVQTQDDRLRPCVPTLSQHFRHSGWRTLGIVANPWFTRRKGLDIGFDRFYNIIEDGSLLREVSLSSLFDHFRHFRSRTGGLTLDWDRHPSEPLIADLASEWLAAADRPAFMMVHTQGAHSPYHSPRAWNSHRDDAESRRSDYFNLVEFVDAQLGRFLDRLGDDALVVVTGDHGEALGESGEWGHKRDGMDLLYDVPLVISGASPPFSQSEPVSHLDVHEWLRDTVAPAGGDREQSEKLQERLEALGYVDGGHSA